jgi:putative transposase
MLTRIPARLRCTAQRIAATVRRLLPRWRRSIPLVLALGATTDLVRRRHELIVENALLRQQLLVLHRRAKRPASRHSTAG